MRFFCVVAGLILAAAIAFAVPANAQPVEQDEAATPSDPQVAAPTGSEAAGSESEEMFEPRAMEEIEVIVDARGRAKVDFEALREEQVIEAIYAEMRLREQEEEEVAWRQDDPDLENPEDRIKWGYSAQSEQRMRRENEYLYDSGTELAKPASLFRVEF